MDAGIALQAATLIAILAWVAKEWWESRKYKDKQHAQDLKENTTAMLKLTISMVELKTKMELLEKQLDKVTEVLPRVVADVNAFHSWKRDVDPKIQQRNQ